MGSDIGILTIPILSKVRMFWRKTMDKDIIKWVVFWSIFAMIFITIISATINGYAPCGWYDLESINNTETRQVLGTCMK